MKIRLAENLTISASVELFPFFQRTNTKKKLSTNKQYVEAKREAEQQLLAMTPDEKYLKWNRLKTQVTVLHPAEYYPAQCTQFSATIVVGWLKRAVMRKILYSFNTQSYTVLTFVPKQCYTINTQGHDILNLWHCFRVFIFVYASGHL